MKANFKTFYFFPLILILSIPILIDAFSEEKSQLFFAFLMTLIFPFALRIALNIKPFIFVLLTAPILFLSIVYLTQVLEYDSYIDVSSWYAIMDTNINEATGFISHSLVFTKILVSFNIAVYLFYLIWTYGKRTKNNTVKIRYIAFGVLLFLIVDYNVRGATEMAFPLRAFQTFSEYFETVKLEKKYLNTKKFATLNATRNSNFLDKTKETIIIVIGETLRRDHLEYYGYRKLTTPFLKKENLLIYKDAISPANQTVNSIQRIFTLAEMLNDNDYWKEPSFIKAFKEVGFSTYWISTQPVYGKHNSKTSFIAQETDKFMAHKAFSHDEVLLNSYKNLLKNTKKKKLILLHLTGSHAAYRKRYPENSNFFAKEKHKDYRVNMLREYDNSVRYNDSILHVVLSELKKEKGEKTFIMFSDHGESLFDTGDDRYGHGSANPSQSEVKIPLIIWFSNEFRNNHINIVKQAENNIDLPIITSDLFHAFPSLFGIEFKKLKLENNIFGKTYIPKTNRKIVNGQLELLEYNKLKSKIADIDY